MLTQERVKELFDYNAETGTLFWKVARGTNKREGLPAGCIGSRGYFVTRSFGKLYYNHRLIWLWVNGYFPETNIDHKNKDKIDNRIENLREVSHQCNIRNSGNRKDNTSGVKGVYWHARAKKWHAFIYLNGRNIYLGIFHDFDNAVCARLAGEQALGWSGCDSSSPAFKYVRDNIQKGGK